jgi:hypothetical protein
MEEVLLEIYHLISTDIQSSSSSSPSSPVDDRMESLQFISIILINLHKGETCPPLLLPHLSSIHLMMSETSPPPEKENDVDFSRWACLAWEGIINPDGNV